MIRSYVKYGADVNARDQYRRTPLHYATDKQVIYELIRLGALLDAEDEVRTQLLSVLTSQNGHTPLQFASSRYNREAINALTEWTKQKPQ